MLTLLATIVLNPVASNFPVLVDGALCHPTRLIVRMREARGESLARMLGARVERRFSQIGFVVLQVPSGRLKQTRDELRKSTFVENADYDFASRPAYVPNDPLWPSMWHYRTLNVDKAWDVSFGSPITVAVIDTGVEVTHPDLAGNVWVNSKEIPGNGIDDDHNGYIDDINGWNFDANTNNPYDAYGHGTACSGLVAAIQDNYIGGCGVAPRAKIMALKAANDSGYFYDSQNIGAYLYASDNGAKVLSMSFFSDRVTAGERVAMDYAHDHGVLPVAAAANANTVYPYYPAAYESVLSVAAIDSSLSKAGFSDFGAWVQVAAPGTSLTTITAGGGYTTGFGGTSGACPQVAGAAALIWGANPLLTNDQVRAILEDTATPTIQYPYGEYTNYGLVDVNTAVKAALVGSAAPRTPVVRYLTPAYGYASPTQRAAPAVTRIYGRGFQAPRNVSVTVGGRPVKVLDRARNWVDVFLPQALGPISVKVDGMLVATIPAVQQPRKTWPAIEAATQGATLYGGFLQMLNPDGDELVANARGDGSIVIEATFRKVTPDANLALMFKRRYTGTSTGTERVFLYDWSSASYPYGNFVLVGETSVTSVSSGNPLVSPLANPSRFIDDEGTVYFYLDTVGVQGSGAIYVDQLNLRR